LLRQSQELAPVIDIMEALKNSLASLKKPPAPAVDSTDEGQLVLTAPAAEGGEKRKRAAVRRAASG
jgi:hypothetical protein